MNEQELYDLLSDLGLDKIKRKNGRKGINFMFCCPFHNERRPSAGIVLDGNSIYGKCFACKESFTLAKLVAHCRGENQWDTLQYLNERYNIERRQINYHTFKEYGEYEEEIRFELPILKIAPFRSGKETHKYFFNRGFTIETLQKFLIGWDRVKKRITIPIFYSDATLSGIMGRAVLEDNDPKYKVVYKNEPKYFIYEHFPIGDNLFGIHCFEGGDTVILVEGTFDLMWMHQLGFTNTLSTIIANLTEKQRDLLLQLNIKEVVLFYDNDAAGRIASNYAFDLLKPFFKIYKVKYPVDCKDPMDLSKGIIQSMLDNKEFFWKKTLRIME